MLCKMVYSKISARLLVVFSVILLLICPTNIDCLFSRLSLRKLYLSNNNHSVVDTSINNNDRISEDLIDSNETDVVENVTQRQEQQQQRLQQIVPDMSNSSNGNAILEDLVNQFMERNKEAVRIREQQQFDDNDEHIMQWVDGSQIETTPIPLMNLIQTSSGSPKQAEISDRVYKETSTELEQSAQQELDQLDKHIHYDMMHIEPMPLQKDHLVEGRGDLQRVPSRHELEKRHEGSNSDLGDIANESIVTLGSISTPSDSLVDNLTVTKGTDNVILVVEQPPFNYMDQVANNGSLRSGNVQARAMSSNKVSKISRSPPYASYDQFRVRTSPINQANQLQTQQLRPIFAGSKDDGTQLSTREAQIGVNSTLNTNNNSNVTTSSLQETATLLNSINQITSILSHDASMNDMKHQQQVTSREQQPDGILQKLASVNQLVELNPIPLNGTNNRKSQDRFASLADEVGGSKDQEASINEIRGTSSYSEYQENSSDHNSKGPSLESSSTNKNSRFGTTTNANFFEPGKPLEANLIPKQPYNANSNSVEPEMEQYLQSPYHGLLHRAGPSEIVNGSFAASLVNITAPMVLPYSATKAMESELGEQAGKDLLYQVSGFVRPKQVANLQSLDSYGNPATTPRPNHSSLNSYQVVTNTKRNQNQYFLPQAFAGGSGTNTDLFQQATYSPPANQFSPSLTSDSIPSSFHHLNPRDQTSSQFGNSINATRGNSLALEDERMRLATSLQSGNGRVSSFHLSATNQRPNSNTSLLHQASGFRSPTAHSGSSNLQSVNQLQQAASTSVWSSSSYPPNYFNNAPLTSASNSNSLTTSGSSSGVFTTATPAISSNTISATISQTNGSSIGMQPTQMSPLATETTNPTTSNGFIVASSNNKLPGNSNGSSSTSVSPSTSTTSTSTSQTATTTSLVQSSSSEQGISSNLNRRVFNLTRVEHISAECSNDLIRTVIVFNGTFKGIIYSSGYVRDPTCLYINGTGKSRYDFSIKLNQCGTLGRQEMHQTHGLNEIRRRDQVMWNTLSIQYNPIIEQEWDEHFRVSCEYGSDFWKTISFSPFNVETNTGSPVVFTVDPPQCQMEILRGHGMVGPRQEAVSGPVTVGDPLTLLIHMKSERAGYDILIKNCVAHNGGHQKMQLIDFNGCVIDERFISPFRGTYNDNDLKHITLYSYLKAFRFTGSPVLYIECEIHMCQSSCPPQMCYWRRLSKRSTNETLDNIDVDENDDSNYLTKTTLTYYQDNNNNNSTISLPKPRREARKLKTSNLKDTSNSTKQNQLSETVSLFQALEVRQGREPDAAYSTYPSTNGEFSARFQDSSQQTLVCYHQAQMLAFLITVASILLVAISITIGCCWRASVKLRQTNDLKRQNLKQSTSANFRNNNKSSHSLSSSSCCNCSIISGSSSMQTGSILSNVANCQQIATGLNWTTEQKSCSNIPSTASLSGFQKQQQHHSTRHKDFLPLVNNY